MVDFLTSWHGTALIKRQPLSEVIAVDASSTIGCGGYWKTTADWFFLPWAAHHVKLYDVSRDLSITWKELYAIVIVAALFAAQWRGKRVVILSDNTGAVSQPATVVPVPGITTPGNDGTPTPPHPH